MEYPLNYQWMDLNEGCHTTNGTSLFCGFPSSTNVSTVPSYSFTFKMEESFDKEGLKTWLFKYHHISLYIAAVYLVLVFAGQAYMKNKQAFQLRKSLILWNSILAFFSIGGALRTLPELYHTYTHFGFNASLCSGSFYDDNSVTALWVWLFMLSKVVELFDTAFVILRKQKLMLLHWFHHSTVLVWTWFLGQDLVAMGRWFMTMNYCVHSFMYSYYALKALRVPIPKSIAMSITTAQVVQMLVGFFISVRGFEMWFTGCDCAITGRIATLSLTLYTFYFGLFLNFFYMAYVYPVVKKALHKSV